MLLEFGNKDYIQNFRERNLLEKFPLKSKMKMRVNIQLDLVKTGGERNVSVSCSILQALGRHIKFHK
jgi:hypothetical protein